MVWEGIRPLVRYREAWKGRLGGAGRGGGDMHAFENSERVWLLFEQQVRSLRGIKRRTVSSYMRTAPYPLYIGSGTF